VIDSLRSEWAKIATTRMTLGLVLTALAFTLLNAVTIIALAGSDLAGSDLPSLTDPDGLLLVYSTVGSAVLLALVLGILAMTSEFRHHTITSTLLATPRRPRLVVAKSLAQALAGAIMGAACMAAVLLALLAASLFKDTAPIDWGEFAAVSGGALLAFAIYPVVGVAFGSLVRNQIAAIIIALVWVMLVEALVVSFLPDVGKWLPGGAVNGLLQAGAMGADVYLDVLPSAVLLLGYGVVFAALGASVTMRRDIT